jgi:hypothetical protein
MAETEDRERQQQFAFQNGFGIYRGILSDKAGVKAREGALKAALERVDIPWKAFQEAVKRAKQNENTLHLFDESAMKLETWLRKLMAGEKLVEPGPDDEKEPAIPEDTFDDEEQAEDSPTPAPQPIEEDPTEPQPLPAAAESDQFEDDPAVAGPQAEEGEPEWDMGDAPAADPKAAQKTAQVAPAAGAAGVSMDDIPMPKSQIHDLQAEQKRRQFVDRRERMPAAEYNERVKAGSSQG